MFTLKHPIVLSVQDTCIPEQARPRTSHLDSAHIGDIQGAWGTIRQSETAPRKSWFARLLALLVIIAIVGTTVAPWQLFFQQSNIID
jgi:hypothetical protein